MAIVYRPQRSELDKAMSEAATFESEEELLIYVKQEWKAQYPNAKFKIKLRALNDDRTGWENTRYVYMTDNGIDAPYRHPKVVGMCDTDTFKSLSKGDALAKVHQIFKEWRENQVL